MAEETTNSGSPSVDDELELSDNLDDEEGAPKRKPWLNLTYTTRMALSFAVIAAMTALEAIGVVSVVW